MQRCKINCKRRDTYYWHNKHCCCVGLFFGKFEKFFKDGNTQYSSPATKNSIYRANKTRQNKKQCKLTFWFHKVIMRKVGKYYLKTTYFYSKNLQIYCLPIFLCFQNQNLCLIDKILLIKSQITHLLPYQIFYTYKINKFIYILLQKKILQIFQKNIFIYRLFNYI